MLNQYQKNLGFTLIEMLVVIAIIGIVSVSIFLSFRTGQKQYSLDQSAQRLILNLRRAQSMGMNALKQEGNLVYGYGVYTNNNSYLIFYNLNQSEGTTYVQGTSQILETINLSSTITLSPLAQSVFFAPPDPKTYINGVFDENNLKQFNLTQEGKTRTVKIYGSGRIE